MLTRGAALLVLAATNPIAAAGLVWEGGRAWFWKAFRWFHAAAFTPVSYTHLRAHETVLDLVCRLLLETKNANLTTRT